MFLCNGMAPSLYLLLRGSFNSSFGCKFHCNLEDMSKDCCTRSMLRVMRLIPNLGIRDEKFLAIFVVSFLLLFYCCAAKWLRVFCIARRWPLA